MDEQTSILELKGIGEKTAKLFGNLGIRTLADLLLYYPRDYDTFEEPCRIEELSDKCVAAVYGMVKKTEPVKRVRNLQIFSATVTDQKDELGLTWFNMPFLRNMIKQGGRYIFRGKVLVKNGRVFMEQPQIYTPAEYDSLLNCMQPIYGLTASLSNKTITNAVKQTFSNLKIQKEYLPEDIREKYALAEYNFAVQTIHFPNKQEDLLFARKRLVFDEFFLFILALKRLKDTNDEIRNDFQIHICAETEKVIKNLPYELTAAQKKVWKEVENNLMREKTMARLIQGDVGSGKTIIAVLALIMISANGYQGALMAPTEVLAKQHFESICALLDAHQMTFRPVLLTGSMTAKEKREAYEKIESGEAQIIIGTHALIQEKVNYSNLALVITDEQHRFGVKQREHLSEKGKEPHVLVMSATPIPRTLAIIIYGDLDISVIDELPAERQPIKNCVVDTSFRQKAYKFIEKEIAAGRQAYVICPMVEESENLEAENVIDYANLLKEELPSFIEIAFLHGKMKAKEKNEIMEQFSKGTIQVLVSTTVVEVGVNVPNATVMMVENSERFGLAQLHQLRGRVGRGEYQSYCIFISSSKNKETKKRLEILNHSNDGFYIASEDLKLRGPGDLFGIRQSGILDFRIGDIFNDAVILQEASEAAAKIFEEDFELKNTKHELLKKKLETYMKSGLESLSL